MHEIDRWEGEGGIFPMYPSDRDTIMKLLTKAQIPFEEDMSGEEGTENDIMARGFGSDDERIYFDFDSNEDLVNIVVYYI
ncbi:hypothetical protein SEA_TOMAS_183 [Streptomyces phage Tomas]|uniref:Uncharacterized protein n=1 Tax=Streptomyces phage Tomas TaxID=2914443 RepID=A0AA49BS52_9CAUD|nr:hypothetical protein PP453_gp134 [Streptomyces phage Tomas]UMO76333.1 hypothetical protein SEA_TOMAS_183 [Streptomyces phage Tomas]